MQKDSPSHRPGEAQPLAASPDRRQSPVSLNGPLWDTRSGRPSQADWARGLLLQALRRLRTRLWRSGVAEQPGEVLSDAKVFLLRVQRARHVINGKRIGVDQLVQLPDTMTTGTDDEIGHLFADGHFARHRPPTRSGVSSSPAWRMERVPSRPGRLSEPAARVPRRPPPGHLGRPLNALRAHPPFPK